MAWALSPGHTVPIWWSQREGIRGQRVGICGQRMDGREDWINITIACIASCLIGVTFTFSYISRYAYISVYNIYLLIMSVYIHELRATVPC